MMALMVVSVLPQPPFFLSLGDTLKLKGHRNIRRMEQSAMLQRAWRAASMTMAYLCNSQEKNKKKGALLLALIYCSIGQL